MEIRQCILTNNDCYKKGKKVEHNKILVHSTGADNPRLSRYVQPDDGILGDNKYDNDWNRSGLLKCVHAFIGKDKDGNVRIYQTLPWDYRCWGCGGGKKGSYNNNAYQFEICEDDLTNEAYFNEAFAKAIELCVYLCKKDGLTADDIISHKEAHELGYANNHGDCDYWLKKFGKDMDWFRNEVKKALNTTSNTSNSTSTNDGYGRPEYDVEKKLLDVDGSWGRDTTFKSQQVFGTKQDGKISHQPTTYKEKLSKCKTSSWEFDDTRKGSQLIRAIQTFLKDLGFYTGKIDGLCEKKTVMAIQEFLASLGLYMDDIDGKMGPGTVTGWQQYINSRL